MLILLNEVRPQEFSTAVNFLNREGGGRGVEDFKAWSVPS